MRTSLHPQASLSPRKTNPHYTDNVIAGSVRKFEKRSHVAIFEALRDKIVFPTWGTYALVPN